MCYMDYSQQIVPDKNKAKEKNLGISTEKLGMEEWIYLLA